MVTMLAANPTTSGAPIAQFSDRLASKNVALQQDGGSGWRASKCTPIKVLWVYEDMQCSVDSTESFNLMLCSREMHYKLDPEISSAECQSQSGTIPCHIRFPLLGLQQAYDPP
jgi:hypothetical protein